MSHDRDYLRGRMTRNFTQGMAPSEVNEGVASGAIPLCCRFELNAGGRDRLLHNLLRYNSVYHKSNTNIRAISLIAIGANHRADPVVTMTVSELLDKQTRDTSSAVVTEHLCPRCPAAGECDESDVDMSRLPADYTVQDLRALLN